MTPAKSNQDVTTSKYQQHGQAQAPRLIPHSIFLKNLAPAKDGAYRKPPIFEASDLPDSQDSATCFEQQPPHTSTLHQSQRTTWECSHFRSMPSLRFVHTSSPVAHPQVLTSAQARKLLELSCCYLFINLPCSNAFLLQLDRTRLLWVCSML